MSELLGTETGVPVEGVGELFWLKEGETFVGEYPEIIDDEGLWAVKERMDRLIAEGLLTIVPSYGTPSDKGFSLMLVLNEPFRESGYETYERTQYWEQAEVEHFADDGQKPKFPEWLTRFVADIQDWTNAGSIYCYDDGPEYDRSHNFIEVKATYDIFERSETPQIKNFDVFLGSAAMHLARLKAEVDSN